MSHKIRVGILFGGRSAEHEISLLSASSVIRALDKEKYEPVLIGIHKSGEWFLYDDLSRCLAHPDQPDKIQFSGAIRGEAVTVVSKAQGNPLVSLNGRILEKPLDVVFPILHGPYGEDGTVQGLLKLANVPFVGAGVLGSAVGMDKDVMKRLLRDAGIVTAKFLTVTTAELKTLDFAQVVQSVGLPLFVKPANMGSSVGVSKVHTAAEFDEKVRLAFQYDRKIVLEECIVGRELECSVLGNEDPIASLPGELIPRHEFYSYEAKYLDEEGTVLEIPAQVTEAECKAIQTLALQAFRVLCCEGMARVDVFLRPDGRVVLNEINTIPGFTKISMYPKLWEVSGLPYPDLIDRLIQLALERFRAEAHLKRQVDATTG